MPDRAPADREERQAEPLKRPQDPGNGPATGDNAMGRGPRSEAGRLGGEAPPIAIVRKGAAHPAAGEQGRATAVDRAEGECGAVTGVWPITKSVFKEFGKDHGTLMAAAVAFYILVSLVPLVVVGVAVFGYVMGDEQARQTVLNFAGQYLPQQKEMLASSVEAVREARGTIGLVGLATLLLTATGGFATLETAINAIWRAPNRGFVQNKAYALLMTVLIGVLVTASLALTALIGWAAAIPGLGWMAESVAANLLGPVLTLLISGLMFTAIYKLLPTVSVDWKPALIAGFITALLWEAFKYAYTWYTRSSFSGDQEATYGVMGSFVGLLMWIYYSSALVLLGSELTWVLQGCPQPEKPAPDGA